MQPIIPINMRITITPSLVTHDPRRSDPMTFVLRRIKELQRLKLTEVSLFLTGVGAVQRGVIQKQLLSTSVTSIPHVHLRHDMREDEAQYYYDQYHTRRFTTHYEFRKHFFSWNKKLRACIGIENNHDLLSLKGIDRFGGMVIDLTHYLIMPRITPRAAALTEQALERFPIIVNHASAFSLRTKEDEHYAFDIRQYDYIKTLEQRVFSDVISLEIANTLSTQKRIAAYVSSLLKTI